MLERERSVKTGSEREISWGATSCKKINEFGKRGSIDQVHDNK